MKLKTILNIRDVAVRLKRSDGARGEGAVQLHDDAAGAVYVYTCFKYEVYRVQDVLSGVEVDAGCGGWHRCFMRGARDLGRSGTRDAGCGEKGRRGARDLECKERARGRGVSIVRSRVRACKVTSVEQEGEGESKDSAAVRRQHGQRRA